MQEKDTKNFPFKGTIYMFLYTVYEGVNCVRVKCPTDTLAGLLTQSGL